MTSSVICGACGVVLREIAKFCDQCGAPQGTPGDPTKYRYVTVLFADVVRSMDLATELEIERYREVMNDLVGRLTAVVQRYQGGTVEYTGDGVMALFGAPVGLEDHAFRACLAALGIQQETALLAADVQRTDGVVLSLRIGLNSGQVIAGDMGAVAGGYTVTGETVGFAQRMESAAPAGGVMVSESTARLVEGTVLLSEPESVQVKGVDDAVFARRLLAIVPREAPVVRVEAKLVGRDEEMAVLDTIVGRATDGRHGVVTVVGPPGIGKSRIAREIAVLAARRGVEVFWAFCESHTSDIPFHTVVRLLRARSGIGDAGGDVARAQLRAGVPADTDPEDLLLLDDLLGIADPEAPMPRIDPDARRRRLIALINTVSLARTEPAMFIVEDAHWIDAVSETILADILAVISRTPAVVLITSRPEYAGELSRVPTSESIALAPLSDSNIAAIVGELLGPDPSVGPLAGMIVARADGNPFFAEEMVRELVQREVLAGANGSYICHADVDEVSVPATVQAAIEARIDRLGSAAKRTLSAASVIGARFGADLLIALGINPETDELCGVELIDQVRPDPDAEFTFRHPLIRAVAYESQLRTERAEWHRRLAEAIEDTARGAVEEQAALIAEHLSAAGALVEAYGWHMRAAAWLTNRDIGAARSNWERACRIADGFPGDDSRGERGDGGEPDLLAMRIAPRTMLCATDWQARVVQESWGRFAELRDLCGRADDKVSLAMGMTGLATELLYSGRPGEGSQVASEQMSLLQSVGNPNLSVGLMFGAFANWYNSGEFGEILRWSQLAIDLAAGNPTMGSEFGIGSPLAIARTFRGVARWWLGHPDWRQDLDDAADMARGSDPTTLALVVAWTQLGLIYGVLRADDDVLRTAEESVRTTEACSNDFAVMGAKFALGTTLLYRDDPADRRRGEALMVQARDEFLPGRAPSLVPLAQLFVAREQVRRGDRTGIPVMLAAVGQLLDAGRTGWSVCGIDLVVQVLLDLGSADEVTVAAELVERLDSLAVGQGSAICDITLTRLRALLARAHGADSAYRELVIRYRARAESLGFEGHVAWADALG